jgi:hypothetical protein
MRGQIPAEFERTHQCFSLSTPVAGSFSPEFSA